MSDLLSTQLSHGPPPVLRVQGEIDIASVDEFRAAVHDALSTCPGVVIDMDAVTFIDAAGLRVIVHAAAKLNGDGPLTLVNAKRVARLLDLVGAHDLPSMVIRSEGDADGG